VLGVETHGRVMALGADRASASRGPTVLGTQSR
jgi:hypothetical protein